MRVDRAELLGGEIPLRPLSVAELLDAALAVLRTSPRAVLGPAAVLVGAVQLAVTLAGYFLVGNRASDEVTPNILLRSLGSDLVLGGLGLAATVLIVLALSGLIAPVLARSFFGQPVSLGLAWRDVRPRLPRLVVVVLLTGLVPPAVGSLALIPFILVAGTNGSVLLGVLTGLAGFPLALAVTVWLSVLGVFAAPAVVLERQGIGAALSRSRRLVSRRWWRTFLLLLLTTVITVFMVFVALRVPFLMVEAIFFGVHPHGWQEVAALAVDTLGRVTGWTIAAPFDAGVIALLYLDRRHRREGLDLELQRLENVPDTDFLSLWARA